MRRIKKARIRFLSLVPKGANQLPVIYKEDGGLTLTPLTKALDNFDEKGELVAVVYAPEMVDSQGDVASAEVIKDMMYDAARNGLSLDVRHDEKALGKDKAFVAESFEIQKGDPRFADMKNYAGEPVDVTGGWGVVVKVEDQELRKQYREGKWQGISMGGTAHVESLKSDPDSSGLLKALAGFFGGMIPARPEQNSGDIDMDSKELTKILADNNKALIEGITKAMKPDTDAAADDKTKADDSKAKADEAPVFKGDPTDIKAIEAHEKALKIHALRKGVDWTSPEAVAEYRTKLAEINKAAEAGEDDEQTAEIKRLEKQLAEAKKRTNQSVASGGDDQTALSKEDQTCVQTAGKMVKYLKELRKTA